MTLQLHLFQSSFNVKAANMFVKLTSLIVLLSIVSVAFSAVSVGLPSVHPDHPGKCWDEAEKKAYTPGEVVTASGCTRVTCGDDFSLDYATCGVIQTEPPCYVADGDLTLEYPMCCSTVKCPPA